MKFSMKKFTAFKMMMAIVAMVVLGTGNLFAQATTADQNVPVGAQVKYGPTTTASRGTFAYEVLKADGTTAADAAAFTGAADGSNYGITWKQAGTYVIKMTETNNSCSTANTFTVAVAGVEVQILASNAEACSSEGNTKFTLHLVNPGTDVAYNGSAIGNLTVVFTAQNATLDATSPLTWDTSAGDKVLTSTFSEKAGNASTVQTVTVSSVETASKTAVPVASGKGAASTTVYDKPAANAIHVIN